MSNDSQLQLFATFLTIRIILFYLSNVKTHSGSQVFFLRIFTSANRLHSSSQHFLASKTVVIKNNRNNPHFSAIQIDIFSSSELFCEEVCNIIGSQHQQFARFFVAVRKISGIRRKKVTLRTAIRFNVRKIGQI